MCIYTFSKKLFNPSNKANPSKKKKVKVHSSTTQRVLSTDLFTILAMFYWIINEEKKHLKFSGPPDPPVNCTVGEPDPFKVNQNQNQKCKVKKKNTFSCRANNPRTTPLIYFFKFRNKRFGCFQTRKTH